MSNVIGILKESIYKWENISQICDLIIMWAVDSGSSDIHIEPYENESRVRYRVDGILKNALFLPKNIHGSTTLLIHSRFCKPVHESAAPRD